MTNRYKLKKQTSVISNTFKINQLRKYARIRIFSEPHFPVHGRNL